MYLVKSSTQTVKLRRLQSDISYLLHIIETGHIIRRETIGTDKKCCCGR